MGTNGPFSLVAQRSARGATPIIGDAETNPHPKIYHGAAHKSRSNPVAVGIPVTRHPPHRSVRALITAYGSSLRCWRQTARRTPPDPWHTRSPALCRERVRSCDVLLGPLPSLHRFRRRLPLFVQQLHRYYCVVRLLQNVHAHRTAFAFADRSRPD